MADEILGSVQKRWIEDVFEGFLTKKCYTKLESLLTPTDPSLHYSIEVSVQDLHHYNGEFVDHLIQNPLQLFPILEDTLIRAVGAVCKAAVEAENMVMKSHLHVRFTEFLQCSELIRDTVPQSRDTGRLLQLSGN